MADEENSASITETSHHSLVPKQTPVNEPTKSADEILQELFDEQKLCNEVRASETDAVTADKNQKSADDILAELFTELGQKPADERVDPFIQLSKKKKHKEKSKKKEKEKDKSKLKKSKKDVGHKSHRKDKGEEKLKKHSVDSNEEYVKKDSKNSKSRDDDYPSKHHKKSKGSEREDKKRSKKSDIEDGEILEHIERLPTLSYDGRDSPQAYTDSKSKGRRRRSRSLSWSPPLSRRRVCPPRNEPDHWTSTESRFRGDDEQYGRRSQFGRDRDYHGHDNRDRSSSRASPDLYRDGSRLHNRNYKESRRTGRDHDHRRSYRSRSRSRSRRPHAEVFDKAKLLEIARRNATLLMKNGVLPTDIFSKDQIVAIKAGGKSVEELTSYCRRLARKEGLADGDGELSGHDSDVGEGSHFIHHPFVVKERPMPQITLNIRNAIPLPVRTPQELAIENAVRKSQFPVSSGTHHRVKEMKELEWKEVEPAEEKAKKIPEMSVVPLKPAVLEKEIEEIPTPAPVPEPIKTNPEPDITTVDVGSVITARLKAIRALKENPDDMEAKKELDTAVQKMDKWAEAKALEPKFLTVSELSTGPQAWAKRDQLKNAKEVAGGMGMHLLQKMGWKPGEGLGKNKEGTTEPLALDVKTDKKGLTAQEDLKQKGPFANLTMLYDLSGKHPVSALMELCTKRRWGPPCFDLCFEHGPPHQKQFVFKVTVNGVEYQPCIATNNKKLAKANAAAFCLQSLGLLKTSAPPAASATLQTVPIEPVPIPPPSNFVASHPLQTVPNQQF